MSASAAGLHEKGPLNKLTVPVNIPMGQNMQFFITNISFFGEKIARLNKETCSLLTAICHACMLSLPYLTLNTIQENYCFIKFRLKSRLISTTPLTSIGG